MMVVGEFCDGNVCYLNLTSDNHPSLENARLNHMVGNTYFYWAYFEEKQSQVWSQIHTNFFMHLFS
jgi:hypothetical protein